MLKNRNKFTRKFRTAVIAATLTAYCQAYGGNTQNVIVVTDPSDDYNPSGCTLRKALETYNGQVSSVCTFTTDSNLPTNEFHILLQTPGNTLLMGDLYSNPIHVGQGDRDTLVIRSLPGFITVINQKKPSSQDVAMRFTTPINSNDYQQPPSVRIERVAFSNIENIFTHPLIQAEGINLLVHQNYFLDVKVNDAPVVHAIPDLYKWDITNPIITVENSLFRNVSSTSTLKMDSVFATIRNSDFLNISGTEGGIVSYQCNGEVNGKTLDNDGTAFMLEMKGINIRSETLKYTNTSSLIQIAVEKNSKCAPSIPAAVFNHGINVDIQDLSVRGAIDRITNMPNIQGAAVAIKNSSEIPMTVVIDKSAILNVVVPSPHFAGVEIKGEAGVAIKNTTLVVTNSTLSDIQLDTQSKDKRLYYVGGDGINTHYALTNNTLFSSSYKTNSAATYYGIGADTSSSEFDLAGNILNMATGPSDQVYTNGRINCAQTTATIQSKGGNVANDNSCYLTNSGWNDYEMLGGTFLESLNMSSKPISNLSGNWQVTHSYYPPLSNSKAIGIVQSCQYQHFEIINDLVGLGAPKNDKDQLDHFRPEKFCDAGAIELSSLKSKQ